jgi:hypothetical protein
MSPQARPVHCYKPHDISFSVRLRCHSPNGCSLFSLFLFQLVTQSIVAIPVHGGARLHICSPRVPQYIYPRLALHIHISGDSRQSLFLPCVRNRDTPWLCLNSWIASSRSFLLLPGASSPSSCETSQLLTTESDSSTTASFEFVICPVLGTHSTII